MTPLLEVQNLCISFRPEPGQPPHRAVDRVSFTLQPGESLGLLGESGSGKTTTALALARLLPPPPACALTGRILIDGEDLLALPAAALRRVRGRRIAYVFQDPGPHMDPLIAVGAQLAEVLRWHQGLGRKAARGPALDLLAQVGLPRPEQSLDAYPHQLSGGMQQRVSLALALASRPALLVADEPTASLDALVQSQILGLIGRLRTEHHLALLLVTHDPEVAAACTDRLAVMQAGRIVETGPTAELLAAPEHEYSRELLRCLEAAP
jgi:ABC-type glutathione transport system ATPase component